MGRLYYLQIYKGSRFKELSEVNRTSILPITAPRGKIYDKNKKVLVSNKLSYTASIIRNKANVSKGFLSKLSEILDLSTKEIKEKIDKTSENEGIIRIKKHISQKELILLEENKNEIPGIIIENIPMREYVYNDLASHVLGYVGEISGKELNNLADQGYGVGDIIGKTGLEQYYEPYLQGKEGKELIEVDNLGSKLRTLGIEEPVVGYDLVLNLDLKLQKNVEKILENNLKSLKKKAKEDEEIAQAPSGGAVIVIDSKDSSILAMASSPSYNPNKFLKGLSREEWNELNNNSTRPFLNRAISTRAPAGSIFKIVTAVAAMEELNIRPETKFYDPGYYETGGVRFNNWLTAGQGEIDFLEGIAWSNNTVFFKLGHKLYKKDRVLLQEYAKDFGLGKKTEIDLNNEAKGLVPDPEWRKKYFQKRENQIWYPGYTINLSIGQGNLKSSPLQLVNLVSAVANGGKLHQPRLVDKIIDSEGRLVKDFKPKLLNKLSFSDKTLEVVREGLKGVTVYGTARRAFKDFPMTVAGKTGTAQTGGDRPNHGWFAGFAPADDPEIAIVVFIEYGASSGNTLPIAKEIIREHFKLTPKDNKDKEQ